MVTWKEKKLGDIAEIRMCKRIFAEQTTPKGEIPFYKIGTFGKEPDVYISRSLYDEYRSKYSYPNKGDILLSAAGTLGRAVVYDGKPAYFQDSNIVWLEIDEEQICNEFLYHCYQVVVWASPEGSTISRLYNGIIRDTDILLPPVREQRRIAEALSDTDALLAAMEKLIAKKRSIKQGAMQELLTGKQRLPGFEGEWVETTLDDLCYLVTKQTGFDYSATIKPSLSTEYRHGYIPFVQNKDFEGYTVNYNTDFFIPLTVAQAFPKILLDEPCLLISISGRIGNVGYYDGSTLAFIGGAVGIARFKKPVQAKWAMLYLQSQKGQELIFANEKAGAQHNLTVADIRNFQIPIPTEPEQTAIAEILSDMDAEIDALTAKLNKLRSIKQGMMSELLTGRIRLADSQASKATVVSYPEQETEPIRKVAEDTAPKGHNQQFDDAVMIAGIVNALYSDKYPLGRKKVQKCLYLLRRYQDESTAAFKKKAAGPYADEVRYKGGEPIAKSSKYIATTTGKQGTTFARGKDIGKALDYIQSWGREADIKWVADKLKFKSVDELELLATVDMAICDLTEAGTPVSVQSIKHLIATNAEWKEKLKKQTFSDANIARAIRELNTLLQGGN